MAIILEGFDGSGKSTLAKKLSEILNAYVYHPGGHPVLEDEVIAHIKRQNELYNTGVIMDRVTSITEACYHDKMSDEILAGNRDIAFNFHKNIVIYCNPGRRTLVDNMPNHQLEDHDSEEDLQKVIKNMHHIIDRYESLFEAWPHIMYDYTDDGMDVNWLANELYLTQNIRGYKKELMEDINSDCTFKHK